MGVREKSSNGKRLIDANALISYIDECSQESRFRVYYGYAKSFINDAPTIDAVPVVRCKDCKHYDMGVCLKIYSDGNMHTEAWQRRKPDDFCSYGERKDGDNATQNHP